MNKKLKIMTIVGTRPELIRLSRVINELERYAKHILVHTGQNYDYELNQIFFDDLNIRKPNYFLDSAAKTPTQTIGKILSSVEKVLNKVKPDALLILGDTNSVLSAIAAKRKKIPIFHMEAGNRCFDMRVPEETNRKIVDHISDINLPYSALAREHLINEGIHANKIIVTGSPMREVLNFYENKIEQSNILEKLNLKPREYYLISFHREENVDDDISLEKFSNLLNILVKEHKKKVLVSLHPRTKQRLKDKKFKFNKNIIFSKPFGFCDYIKLQKESHAVLSDSGTISEESSILNFPALNIREAHERPEAMEEGSVMMVGLDHDRIFQALRIMQKQSRGSERDLYMPLDYKAKNVSKKVLRIIHSYVNSINQKDWLKK